MTKSCSRIVLLLSFMLPTAHAMDSATVDELLARDAEPAGVVFEIVASDEALSWAVPQINRDVRALRERWPDLEIAVVSHGAEQFALMTDQAEENSEVHAGVQELVTEQNVPVHVCETHASWRNVNAEDFPDYVDVTPVGPVQIRMYQELGYELVVISGY